MRKIAPPADHVVLLRGQKDLTPDLRRAPREPGALRQLIHTQLYSAAQHRLHTLDGIARHEAISMLSPVSHGQHKRREQLWKEATPLDVLVSYHQSGYGCPLFVSATRSLSVAAGDYNMRTTDNRNRFIYVLDVPMNQAVNVYGMERCFSKELGYTMEGSTADHGHEQEVVVWLDATPCIAGIYDCVTDAWVQPPG